MEGHCYALRRTGARRDTASLHRSGGCQEDLRPGLIADLLVEGGGQTRLQLCPGIPLWRFTYRLTPRCGRFERGHTTRSDCSLRAPVRRNEGGLAREVGILAVNGKRKLTPSGTRVPRHTPHGGQFSGTARTAAPKARIVWPVQASGPDCVTVPAPVRLTGNLKRARSTASALCWFARMDRRPAPAWPRRTSPTSRSSACGRRGTIDGNGDGDGRAVPLRGPWSDDLPSEPWRGRLLLPAVE
jgi:hypothetical protein